MERGSADGGMSCAVLTHPQTDENREDDVAQHAGSLVVTRITDGQSIVKVFAERIVCKAIVSDIKALQGLKPEQLRVASVMGLHSDFLPKVK